MKKGLKVGMIICALVLLAAVLYAGREVFSGSFSYAHAEKYAAGGASIGENVRNLDVHWVSGKVHIAYHEGTGLESSEWSAKPIPEDRQLRWWLDGETLRVQYEKPGVNWGLWNQPLEKELTMNLPQGIGFETVTISATSGDLDIPDLHTQSLGLSVTSGRISAAAKADAVTISATSGDISLKLAETAQALTVGTTSGSIGIDAQTVGRISVSSTSGTIQAAAADAESFEASSTSGTVSADIIRVGTLKISTTSGSITARVGSFGKMDAGSTSGTVTVFLPEQPGFTARVETTSGGFEYDLPLSKQAGSYVCGDGSRDVHLHATSGDIRLKKNAE